MLGLGVTVCPPYTFAVGKFLRELFITDPHVLPNHLGGTENGVVITFSNMVHFLQWLSYCLQSSGIKTESS